MLAVYSDEQTADKVILDLREQMGGLRAERGQKIDEQNSLNAEMSEEVEKSWLSPQAGVLYPKESMKTAAGMFPLLILPSIAFCGIVAMAWPGDMRVGTRALIGAGIALMLAGTVTLVLMSLGQKRPNEPMAAERGVVVRVHDDRAEVRKLLLDAHPLRLDVVDDQGRPIETLTTQGDSSSAREIGKRVNEWP